LPEVGNCEWQRKVFATNLINLREFDDVTAGWG